MRACTRTSWIVGLMGLLMAVGTTTLSAQEEIGALYGTATDTEGAVLPGVTVTLTGIQGQRIQISDSLGKFRFLRLDPGLFDLEAELDGFSPVTYAGILIRAGRNTTVEMKLDPAIQEMVTVTSESPLLDERQLIQGTALERTDLEKIPTAGDPWAVLTLTPGCSPTASTSAAHGLSKASTALRGCPTTRVISSSTGRR